MQELIPAERIVSKIYLIRGKKVMLDRDLAELYGVPTKVLNQAVRRNIARFPDDFMLKLSKVEMKNLRSQFVTSNPGRGGVRYESYAFTEQGVAMISSILNSERAILVNIQIIRTFTRLREMIAENAQLHQKLEEIEQRYDDQFRAVFEAIRQLLDDGETSQDLIGFNV